MFSSLSEIEDEKSFLKNYKGVKGVKGEKLVSMKIITFAAVGPFEAAV